MPDPVLRHTYGGQLESAAEAFLLHAFEAETGPSFNEQDGPSPVLVSAAMHIITRSAWTQPSDEQVKASMFLCMAETPRGRGYRDVA
ncbi:MAG: hypothetical protein R3181_06395 [Rubricoccaceae bacterium]|nr:hypothetical protein [Rubricoccaceae bacterium]